MSTEQMTCAVCGEPFKADDQMVDIGEGPQEIHVHDRCATRMSDDVYRDLPLELIATLRDPRVVLPGEMEFYEKVCQWLEASPHPVPGVYIDAQGNTVSVSSDTPPKTKEQS